MCDDKNGLEWKGRIDKLTTAIIIYIKWNGIARCANSNE